MVKIICGLMSLTNYLLINGNLLHKNLMIRLNFKNLITQKSLNLILIYTIWGQPKPHLIGSHFLELFSIRTDFMCFKVKQNFKLKVLTFEKKMQIINLGCNKFRSFFLK